jgi:putative component of toxin-antitoxin plasmid stabilization module
VDQNALFISNGNDPVFVALPSQSTAMSTGTQALIAKDVALFDTRLMYWNVRYLSSSSQLVQRVAWTVKGNPEDVTSIGAGFQDLFDMKGFGTRVFTRTDEVLLATDQEIWRGRAIGPPFDFQFDPFSRVLGVPYPRAAINTPEGLFWVGPDFMVYRMQPYFWSQIEPVGAKIQRALHQTVGDPTTFNFGYHPDAKQLTLYYQAIGENTPHRGYTLNTISGTWTPEVYQHGMAIGFSTPINSASTQWNQLVGGFPAQALTYNQLLGAASEFNEATASSGGTVYVHMHPVDQATDDGVAVTHTATFGALFGGLPERRQFADTVRLDMRADSTSSMSVALSGDLGHTFPSESLVTISANSNTSFHAVRLPGISGVYHMVRVSSTGGTWELNQGSVLARVEGEAF